MTNEKWEQLVEMVKKHFTNVKQWQEEIWQETETGPEKRGLKDIVEFLHPTRINYRLVRESRPLVLDKKEHFSHRMGDTARVEYTHSKTEFIHKLKVYKESNFDEWDEVTLDSLGM